MERTAFQSIVIEELAKPPVPEAEEPVGSAASLMSGRTAANDMTRLLVSGVRDF